MKTATETPYTVSGTKDPISEFEKNCITNSQLYRTIHNQAGSEVEITREETTGNQYVREARVRPRPEAIPAALRAFLGSDGFDVQETTTYDFRAHQGMTQTTLLGGPLKGKVNAKTSMAVRASAPFQPRGIIHVLETDIQANVWLIGSQLEKTMAQEIEKKRPDIQKLTQATLDANSTNVQEAA